MSYERRKITSSNNTSNQQSSSTHKFHQPNSYDKIITALNSQQTRIKSLLKLYAEQPTQNIQNYFHKNKNTHQTISVQGKNSTDLSYLNILQDYQRYNIKNNNKQKKIVKFPQLNDVSQRQNDKLPKIKSGLHTPYQKIKLKPNLKDSIIKNAYTEREFVNVVSPKHKRHRKRHKKLRQKIIRIKQQNLNELKRYEQIKNDTKINDKEGVQQNRQQYENDVMKQEVQSEDSIQKSPLPLKEYYDDLRKIMKSQIQEQTNYLYFENKSNVKNWTQGIQKIFEKHDKDLLSFRKSSRYLQKFDQSFFISDSFIQ